MSIRYKESTRQDMNEPVVFPRPDFHHRVMIYRALQDEYELTFKEVEFLVSRAYDLDDMEIVREDM
jgi:hypothetical protein